MIQYIDDTCLQADEIDLFNYEFDFENNKFIKEDNTLPEGVL